IGTEKSELEKLDLEGMKKAYNWVFDNLDKEITIENIEQINLWVGVVGKRIHYAGSIRVTIPMDNKGVLVYSGGHRYIGAEAGSNGKNLVDDLEKLLEYVKTIPAPYKGFAYSAKATLMQYFKDGNKRTARLVQDWMNAKEGYLPISLATEEAKIKYEKALTELFYKEDAKEYIKFFTEQYAKQQRLYR
ncbi:MAG: hypothetical protein LBB07_02505, partial [Bifidobacteriaceae bacterium]|nr:hypothetical protein [Bifidobacteriaceae bacterium]